MHAEELKFEVVLLRRQNVRGKPGSGNTKDAQSFDRHRPHLMHHPVGFLRIEVAQIDNGLGRTLCSDEPLRLIGRLPDARHGQHFGRQRVVVHQSPVRMEMLSIGKQALPGLADRRLHRIEGAAVTGEHRVLEKAMQFFLQGRWIGWPRVAHRLHRPQTLHRHAVDGQGARLVDAEHGGGA